VVENINGTPININENEKIPKSYSLTKKMRESVAVFSIIKVLRDPITHRVGGETVL
jgi:hypothetical protein